MAPETRHYGRLRNTLAIPSMRPGQDGPGNLGGPDGPELRPRAFNEAGARWPRKRTGRAKTWTFGSSFNEAGARWPRKPPALPA